MKKKLTASVEIIKLFFNMNLFSVSSTYSISTLGSGCVLEQGGVHGHQSDLYLLRYRNWFGRGICCDFRSFFPRSYLFDFYSLIFFPRCIHFLEFITKKDKFYDPFSFPLRNFSLKSSFFIFSPSGHSNHPPSPPPPSPQ